MDRFVIREPRTGADFPQGNQMITFSANAGSSNMISPETIYFSGPFASEFPNVQRTDSAVNSPYNMNAQLDPKAQNNIIAQHYMNAQLDPKAQSNINAQHYRNAQLDPKAQNNINAQHYMNAQLAPKAQNNINAQHYMNAQLDPKAQNNINAQHDPKAQHNTFVQHGSTAYHKMNVQQNMLAQPNNLAQKDVHPQHTMNLQTAQLDRQGVVSGIDPRYLAGYTDNSAQFTGQQIQRNTPINTSFGSDYQNRSFDGIDRNKKKSFATQVIFTESPRVEAVPQRQPHQLVGQDNKNVQNAQQRNLLPQLKKPNELDLLKTETQNQVMTRADKLKALYKSGPRAFSGSVEKVLKWHKSLQDIGVMVFYEIVAKCVSVRPGESCSKNLVVRDDNGPAMQVVYYEIDFLLPELKPPCTIRVIGRMMAGTCRLQAFNVRPATGDDVATLPRRAAVAAHHVDKLCKEYGPNSQHV